MNCISPIKDVIDQSNPPINYFFKISLLIMRQ